MSVKGFNIENIISGSIEKKIQVPESIDLDYEDFLIRFANKLYNYRIKNSMTQKELGAILNMNQEMVSRYESALEDITAKKLFDIIEKLNLNLEMKLINKRMYILNHPSRYYWCVENIYASKYERFMQEVALHIKHYRKIYGLTQVKFAELLSETQGMVSKYESGNFNFKLKKLFKIFKMIDSKIFYKENHNEFFDFIFSRNSSVKYIETKKVINQRNVNVHYGFAKRGQIKINKMKDREYDSIQPLIGSFVLNNNVLGGK